MTEFFAERQKAISRISLKSGERKALFNVFHVGVCDKRYLAKIALALCILGYQEVTLALSTPKNLSGASDLKSLGHGLLGFGLSGYSCHRLADNSDETAIGNSDFRLRAKSQPRV